MEEDNRVTQLSSLQSPTNVTTRVHPAKIEMASGKAQLGEHTIAGGQG
jgi:hypothetical protein